jgi:hypothetical protein
MLHHDPEASTLARRTSQLPKKVLAIHDERLIFTPVSFWAEGLSSPVTTELPGDEQVKGPVPVDPKVR